MRAMPLAALAALGCASLPALAQTPDAAGAAQEEARVRAGLATLLGPGVALGQPPVHITPADGRYNLLVRLGDGADAPSLTGTGLPDAKGLWTIDNIRITSPAKFTNTLPNGQRMTYTLTTGEQSGRAVLDPALAQPSTLTLDLHDYRVSSTGGPNAADTKAALLSNSFATKPASPGRVDTTFDAGGTGYKIAVTLPNSQDPINVGVGSIKAVGTAKNLSVAAAVQLYRDVMAFNATMQAVKRDADATSDATSNAAPGQSAGRAGAPAPDQAATEAVLKRLMTDLTQLLSAGNVQETLSDVTVDSGGTAGSMRRVELDMEGADEAGVTHFRMPLALEGLVLPELGLGDAVQLIPSKLALTPRASGVPTAALATLMKHGPYDNGTADADVAALFAPGTMQAGLDDVSVVIGPSQLDGHFTMSFKSQKVFSGTGQITMTNFDGLQQLVMANPMTAQGGAVLILAKGIARNEGNKLVWDLNYANGRMLVNNQDLSALAGGGGGGGGGSSNGGIRRR